MNLQEIEQKVANLNPSQGFEFIYDLLRAYGIPRASISRLKSGTYDRSKSDNEHLWKGKLYYRFVEDDDDLYILIDDAKNDERIMRERPRFLIVRNDERLLAIDTKVESTLDISISELSGHTAFFLPWAGIEKTQLESLNYADVKAAEKMARLYDEIVKHNEISTSEDVHNLNVFFSRLLFCFFSEDTGVFPRGAFTNAIGSLTKESGEDTGQFLDQLFEILDSPPNSRRDMPAHFVDFGYVNGKLFSRQALVPRFSQRARRVILECGTLDWSQINPDIFGSMIQAVVHPGQREGLGMHYTSVENIMKVIRPVFLDDLEKEFHRSSDSVSKLERLLDRVASLKVFDPACGSGNFLVIAYKELRKLEHRVIQRLGELDPTKVGLFKLSSIKLENFYGIEIDHFAHEVAILSLWLAKHQMNVDFHELFGIEISLIPLRDTGNVVCENATRIDWETVCKPDGNDEVYILGNPPYRGASLQSEENRRDLEKAFGSREFDRRMDYISAWFIKGAEYVARYGSKLGFVSTNSICQGGHVEMLWPLILAEGVSISFAHTSFPWSNQARGNAGVTVVVVGLERNPVANARIYSDGTSRSVDQISPYLTSGKSDVIVRTRSSSISHLPKMDYGSKPVDGGFLTLDASEADALLAESPQAEQFIRGYMGSAEFIRGIRRHCIWIDEGNVTEAMSISSIADRVRRVERFRLASKKGSTRNDAKRAWQFQQIRHKESPSIIIPLVTSERREYIPMDFLGPSTIISNSANAVFGAEPWVLSVLQSRMHMVWARTVSGRLKADVRYSAVLCYNTFPIPQLTENEKSSLSALAMSLLEVRERFPDRTPGQLYDPDDMPLVLRRAHELVDQSVDTIYQQRPFESDEERLEILFQMYVEMTTENSVLARA